MLTQGEYYEHKITVFLLIVIKKQYGLYSGPLWHLRHFAESLFISLTCVRFA